jgi:hypothetical protein
MASNSLSRLYVVLLNIDDRVSNTMLEGIRWKLAKLRIDAVYEKELDFMVCIATIMCIVDDCK